MVAPGADEPVQIGEIKGVWGTRGWVKVFSYTQPAEAIFEYQPWALDAPGAFLRVLEWRKQGRRLVARLEDIDDATQAEPLIGQALRVRRGDLPETEPDRFYWSDLIGLEVFNLQNHRFGRLHRLIETGANDVMDIHNTAGESLLIPFVMDHYVKSVDLEAARIVVDYPLEWLDETESAEPDNGQAD